jgi:ABC-type polysaccharide/polyol phosphate transport system ATPase subunit
LRISLLRGADHGQPRRGTLKNFCEKGILMSNGAAYWFDDIADALSEYKKV